MNNYSSQEMGGQYSDQQKKQSIQQNQIDAKIRFISTSNPQILKFENNNNNQQNKNENIVILSQNQKQNQQQNNCLQTPLKNQESAEQAQKSSQFYEYSNQQYQQQSRSEMRVKPQQFNNPAIVENQNKAIPNNQTLFIKQNINTQIQNQQSDLKNEQINQIKPNKIKILPKQNDQQIQPHFLSQRQTPREQFEDSVYITKSLNMEQIKEQKIESIKPSNKIRIIENKQDNNNGQSYQRYQSQQLSAQKVDCQQKQQTNVVVFEKRLNTISVCHYDQMQSQQISQQQPQQQQQYAAPQLLLKPSATSYLEQQSSVLEEEIDLQYTDLREQQMNCHLCGHSTSNYLNLSCSHCIHQSCLTSKFNDFIRKKTEGYISCLCGERIGNTLLRAIINDEQFSEYLDRQAQYLIKNFRDKYGWTD